ncbi:hypothetical protein HI814_14930 [Ralstonia solanacearum]|nr:hypothetical protein HI814_14930 [Ralstonia solanacearum]QKM33904.1 hypothetical protein HI794_14925 [Ralstonia solanacearum]QKM38891.1 hypothetical protein HI793_14935 [Ralstonia solanacearum]
MFPAKIENLRRNPVCLQRYRHVVARKRQHGLTTTLIYATTPRRALSSVSTSGLDQNNPFLTSGQSSRWASSARLLGVRLSVSIERGRLAEDLPVMPDQQPTQFLRATEVAGIPAAFKPRSRELGILSKNVGTSASSTLS